MLLVILTPFYYYLLLEIGKKIVCIDFMRYVNVIDKIIFDKFYLFCIRIV